MTEENNNFLYLEFNAETWEKFVILHQKIVETFYPDITAATDIKWDKDRKIGSIILYHTGNSTPILEKPELIEKIKNFKLDNKLVFNK